MTRIWYTYDPENGYETWATASEAEADAENVLEHFRDKSTDGWHEETERIEWGLLVPYGETHQCDRKDAEPGSDFDYTCDYRLCSAPGDDPLEAACRKLERAERERDEARAMAERLRAALEEKGCRPIAAGNDCEGCKAVYAATEKP